MVVEGTGVMKKIKILQFTVAASKGGHTQYILNNWKYIDKNRFQFDFITFSPKLDFEQSLLQEGCRIYHMSCHPEKDKGQFVRELDAILEQGYDVMHLHTSFWKDTIVEERARAKGVRKIIIHGHATSCSTIASEESKLQAECIHYRIRDTLTENIATDFWACSQKAAEWLYGDRIDSSKIKIFKNAIDIQRFSYDATVRREAREKLSLDSKYVIGNVGRMEYIKNQKYLLDVFVEVLKQIPSAVLLFVGDGKLRQEISLKAVELGILESIIFAGLRDDTEKWYQVMDVFALPSFSEAAPFVLLEAQTAGLKCICSENVSNEFFYTDNVQSVALANPKEWVDTIVDLHKGYQRQDQSNVIAKAGFNLRVQIKELEKAYEKI